MIFFEKNRYFFLKKLPAYLAGFYLTNAPSSIALVFSVAGGDDTTRPHHQGKITSNAFEKFRGNFCGK
jgi:hypothetical protein